MSTLARASWRHLARHPWQSVLAVTGIALGVAVIVSIDVAGASSQRAFEISSEQVTGRATHRIVGGPAGVPDEAYRALRVDLGVMQAAPIVEGRIAIRDQERTLQMLGIDLFAERPFRDHLSGTSPADGRGLRLLTEPNAAVLSARTAAELGTELDGTLEVQVGDRVHSLRIVSLVTAESEAAAASLDDLLIVDIATAQEVLDSVGRLSRIDLILPSERGEGAVEEWTRSLPAGLRIVRSEARSKSAENMTAAFRINLRALSLLALVCGAFLIYNTMTFSIVQRRATIGTLRALGVTRQQISRVVLTEAFVIGSIGALIGTLVGLGLARLLIDSVVQTVNDLYFAVQVRRLAITPWLLARSIGLGIGAAVIAALQPAREASHATPSLALTRSSIEDRSRRNAPRQALAAVVLVTAGALVLTLGPRSLIASFGALFLILLGGSLFTPWITIAFSTAAGRALSASGFVPRLAAGSLKRHLSRTSVAIAALAIAVSVSVGIGLMIRSFRSTVDTWLEFSLPADLYLTARGSGPDALTGIDPELIEEIAELPGILRANRLRYIELELDDPILLTAIDIDERSHSAFRLKEGSPDEAWPLFDSGKGVLVSEPFAERIGVQVGEMLELPSRNGATEFEIAGIYYDYSSDRGVAMIHRRAYIALWDDPEVTAVSFFLANRGDLDRVTREIRALIGSDERYYLRSDRALRDESLAIFDRTFLITRVLRLLVTLVAFVGILSALMAIQLERAQEIGVLRALGLTRSQVWRLVTTETGLLGLVAALLSLPLGLATAWMMVYVINKRSFGWTMPLQIDPAVFAQAAFLAVVPALLAGAIPAWKISRTTAAEALRDE